MASAAGTVRHGACTGELGGKEAAPSSLHPTAVQAGLFATQLINAVYNVLAQHALSPSARGGAAASPLVFCAWRDICAWPVLVAAAAFVASRGGASRGGWATLPPLLPPDRREWPQLAVQALLGVFCNQLFFLYGVQMTDATTAAITNLSLPVFTATLAVCLRVEPPRWRTAAGVALAVVGAATLKLDLTQDATAKRETSSAGVALLLLGALASACYMLLQASMLRRHTALLVASWEFLVGAVLVAAAAVACTSHDELAVPKAALPALAFAVIGNSCLKYFLTALCNKHAGAVVTTVWSAATPALTALLSILFLGASLRASHLGALPVALGAYLVTVR